ncbi:hypothetical protein [Paraburkholderia silvatlantica]|uniref:Uncharacterized protein n=1 Tax=Paraburkholderia silvatlantica TaxID=321895 RepID=A0ABR6FNJ3_9BURK|nr:hypothetical protein [Paraburkholderia silvatlantica]MBB2928365.1 hypothetical protein [Paraburkholderia silvatlantica]
MNIVDRIIARAKRTPYFHLTGYMERFWLFRDAAGPGEEHHQRIAARAHHILRSDDDRHFHDHPWPSISIVLRGGYWEVMPTKQDQHASLDFCCWRRVWRGPGAIVIRRAHHRHRLEIPVGKTAWSLFIMGRYTKKWGFYTPQGFVYWRDYLGIPEGNGA